MTRHVEIDRPDSGSIEPGIYFENAFYPKAGTLRADFEKAIMGGNAQNAGLTPLTYAYHRDAYQFLTAGAERCFSEETLADFIEKLQIWAGRILGASHISTPQVRVYVHGCSRKLSRDDVAAPWHFLLSLTPGPGLPKKARVRILRENGHANGGLGFQRLLSSTPVFNQLLVHSTRAPYSIEGAQASMNPMEGVVFLDGYMW